MIRWLGVPASCHVAPPWRAWLCLPGRDDAASCWDPPAKLLPMLSAGTATDDLGLLHAVCNAWLRVPLPCWRGAFAGRTAVLVSGGKPNARSRGGRVRWESIRILSIDIPETWLRACRRSASWTSIRVDAYAEEFIRDGSRDDQKRTHQPDEMLQSSATPV